MLTIVYDEITLKTFTPTLLSRWKRWQMPMWDGSCREGSYMMQHWRASIKSTSLTFSVSPCPLIFASIGLSTWRISHRHVQLTPNGCLHCHCLCWTQSHPLFPCQTFCGHRYPCSWTVSHSIFTLSASHSATVCEDSVWSPLHKCMFISVVACCWCHVPLGAFQALSLQTIFYCIWCLSGHPFYRWQACPTCPGLQHPQLVAEALLPSLYLQTWRQATACIWHTFHNGW